MTVDIGTEWNLKDYHPGRYRHRNVSWYRNRVEFKGKGVLHLHSTPTGWYRNRVEFKAGTPDGGSGTGQRTEWNLKEWKRSFQRGAIRVDIGTEWNLKYMNRWTHTLRRMVDIGTEWNLKEFTTTVEGNAVFGWYRNRVEFKAHSAFPWLYPQLWLI